LFECKSIPLYNLIWHLLGLDLAESFLSIPESYCVCLRRCLLNIIREYGASKTIESGKPDLSGIRKFGSTPPLFGFDLNYGLSEIWTERSTRSPRSILMNHVPADRPVVPRLKMY
jgi:hypothetical protein